MIEYDLGRTQAGKTVRTIDLYPPVSVQISGLRVGALLDPIISRTFSDCKTATKINLLPRRGYCVEGSKNRCSSRPWLAGSVGCHEIGRWRLSGPVLCTLAKAHDVLGVQKTHDIGRWSRSGPVLCTSVKVQ